MVFGSSQRSQGGLRYTNEIVILLIVLIEHLETELLSGFEDVVYYETLGEVGVQIVHYGLGAPNISHVLVGMTFECHLHVGVGLAEEV